MIVQLISSGEDRPTYIELADSKDYRLLTKGRFHFDWRVYKHESGAHVLRLEVDDEILGAMKLVHFPDEERVEVELIASSKENTGKNKKYDRIPGCLLGFACINVF